ncbi:MAG: hypothetical protein ACKV2O_13520 [Acidimicrobiales bacterium]
MLLMSMALSAACGAGLDSPPGTAVEAALGDVLAAPIVLDGARPDDPPGFALPPLELTPGVITNVEVHTDASMPTAPWPSGATITLDRCQYLAPGRWLLAGSLGGDVPAGSASMMAEVINGDMGIGAPLTVRVSGPGPFQLPIILSDGSGNDLAGSSCSLVGGGSGSGPRSGEVAVTVNPQPLTWTAPANSVQNLGQGAQLEDLADGRMGWARLVWMRVRLPFEHLWLPAGDLAASEMVSFSPGNAGCSTLSFNHAGVTIIHENGCSSNPPTNEPIDGGPWLSLPVPQGAAAVRIEDRMVITVFSSPEVDLPTFLAALAPRPNLFATEPVPDPAADLETTISRMMEGRRHEFESQTIRARLAVPDGYLVVTVGETVPSFNVRFQVRADLITTHNGRWAVGTGGGVEFDGCFGWTVVGDGTGHRQLAVLGDPSWTLQLADGVGGWTVLETVNGVWINAEAVADPRTLPIPRFRAFTATGEAKLCPRLQS